jgi:hypothetical protein
MSSLTASSPVPFGQRRPTHPALGFGAATLGSIAVIAIGWGFLSDTIRGAAANAPSPRTDRQVWYTPAARPTAAMAAQLDIARSVPVKVLTPVTVQAETSIFTHKVGVEALKVRAGPAKSTNQVFALKGGALVSVGATRNGWIEITTQDGRRGWVYAKFLNPA